MCIFVVFRIFFTIGWCLDRPILHVGGLTLSLSIRFTPASNSDVVNRFSAAMFRYFIIILVVGPIVVVGVTGLTIRNVLFA